MIPFHAHHFIVDLCTVTRVLESMELEEGECDSSECSGEEEGSGEEGAEATEDRDSKEESDAVLTALQQQLKSKRAVVQVALIIF